MITKDLPPPPYHWERDTARPEIKDCWYGFQTITASDTCKKFSLEELRLEHYKAGASLNAQNAPPAPPYHWEKDNFAPWRYESDRWVAFQTITARRDCEQYSLEELRLEDYKHGVEKPKRNPDPFDHLVPREDRARSDVFDMMQGPGIEIRVGEDPNTQQTWSLPQNLLSYHSKFFKTACKISLREREEKLICLPTDSPDIFRLFVEWLYFGKYTLPLIDKGRDNMDRQAWVLGDKLLCREFKEYAMTSLYGSYCGVLKHKRLTPDDVEYACKNSPARSGLQRLVFDIVRTYLPRMDTSRLAGTEEEWTAVLKNYEGDCGMSSSYLMGMDKPNEVQRNVEDYFDAEEINEEQAAFTEMPFWGRLDV